MSDYEYTHAKSGLAIGRLDDVEKICIVAPQHHAHVPHADAPTIAAEILKAAGRDGVFIQKAYEEVERLGDELTCGSGPEWAEATIHANPNWLRNRAANCIALAEYIESKAQREADAGKKLQERRDKIARDIGERYDGIPAGSYHTGTWRERVAIDRIIELEDGQATA